MHFMNQDYFMAEFPQLLLYRDRV